MALTGNKGEWSEIYTLLKLLGEGKVYAGVISVIIRYEFIGKTIPSA